MRAQDTGPRNAAKSDARILSILTNSPPRKSRPSSPDRDRRLGRGLAALVNIGAEGAKQ